MITPPIWALTRLAVVAKPSVLTVALSRTMGHALFDSFQTVAEASLMDLHQGDSAGLSKSLSSLGQGIALAVLIGKLGGVLVHTECLCCRPSRGWLFDFCQPALCICRICSNGSRGMGCGRDAGEGNAASRKKKENNRERK